MADAGLFEPPKQLFHMISPHPRLGRLSTKEEAQFLQEFRGGQDHWVGEEGPSWQTWYVENKRAEERACGVPWVLGVERAMILEGSGGWQAKAQVVLQRGGHLGSYRAEQVGLGAQAEDLGHTTVPNSHK